MTINFKGVTKDATHRYRAINMLSGFTSVFIVGSLALMGHQTHRTLGVEWLIVSLVAAAIDTNGYIQAFRLPGTYALSPFRVLGGSACYLGQIIGSLVLYSGLRRGLYQCGSTDRQLLLLSFRLLASHFGPYMALTRPRSEPLYAGDVSDRYGKESTEPAEALPASRTGQPRLRDTKRWRMPVWRLLRVHSTGETTS